MELRRLGRTGLLVTRLGIGMAEAGFNLDQTDIAQVRRLIDVAVDAGVNFLDTAACYGLSEELIGEAITGRRDRFYIATKASYLDEDSAHRYDAVAIEKCIDRSLQRLGVEHIDVIQLHSCSIEIMERGEAIDGLRKAREAGKVRYLGYSGDNNNAQWAVRSGMFDTLQTSFNLVDQRAGNRLFQDARAQEMGIIVKRPIANRVWGQASSPFTYRHAKEYGDEYFRRAEAMRAIGPIEGAPEDDIALALGFVMSQEEVDVAIVGTANPDHLAGNIATLEKMPAIADEVAAQLRERWAAVGADWPQAT